MEQELILIRLLEKYEKSMHLLEPNTSNRRVMLQIHRNGLPEYDYETAETRDRFNDAARKLENENLVTIEWLKDRPVITVISLNLEPEQVYKAYQTAGRPHPVRVAQDLCAFIENTLPTSTVKTPWINAWRDETCRKIRKTSRLPAISKQGLTYAHEFIRMLAYYDSLDGAAITMRTFSIACFQNSKRFEQEFQSMFLREAKRFNPEISEISAQDEFGDREKLALLGIYSHPELYQISGRCTIKMQSGEIDVSPLFPYGIAIPGSAVDEIVSFELQDVRRIIFIENLTNYNEYLLSEIAPDELVIYHGGYNSPKKRQLLQKISESVVLVGKASERIKEEPPESTSPESTSPETGQLETAVYFWADIDLGGFQMFDRLRKIFPKLRPMRMSGDDVVRYASLGLAREPLYLNQLQTALMQNKFPLFEESIRMILHQGVTIEQEVFLT